MTIQAREGEGEEEEGGLNGHSSRSGSSSSLEEVHSVPDVPPDTLHTLTSSTSSSNLNPSISSLVCRPGQDHQDVLGVSGGTKEGGEREGERGERREGSDNNQSIHRVSNLVLGRNQPALFLPFRLFCCSLFFLSLFLSSLFFNLKIQRERETKPSSSSFTELYT